MTMLNTAATELDLATLDAVIGGTSTPKLTEAICDGTLFAVEREMKESGEKGGTADLNIGVGELQKLR